MAAIRGSTNDYDAPPGDNYDAAEFRLWIPASADSVRAVVVLVPGSNEDGRKDAEDVEWQSFAARNRFALLGSRFTDKRHPDSFIEEYVRAGEGSGAALERALSALAETLSRRDVAAAPLLLWGMSAGGQFNYEFVGWRPERVAAFVVNKGGIYYSALLPESARRVPGIFFTGASDLEYRKSAVEGLFALNRQAGALWSFAEEPGIGHDVGRSRDLAMIFFEDVIDLRLGPSPRPIDEASGFVADAGSGRFAPARAAEPSRSGSWLPTERVARAWADLVAGRPSGSR